MSDYLSSNKKFIFVVGNSRSGTTMMGRILGKHHSIFTFHEIHFFEELALSRNLASPIDFKTAKELLSNLFSIQRDGYLKQRTPEEYYSESEELITAWEADGERLIPIKIFGNFLLYESDKQGATIPCDQTPRNLFFVSEILEHYPNAKVINMIRDPRDVLLSQKKKWKRRFLGADNIPVREALRSWANYHPYIISKLWNSSIKASERVIKNDRFLNIHFEELLAEPEKILQKICDFLEIDYSSKMLEIPQVGSSSSQDRPETKGINASRASSWEQGGLTQAELKICQNVCKNFMNEHGYEIKESRGNSFNVAGSLMKLPFKITLSFLMNFNRYKNISESIKRRFA